MGFNQQVGLLETTKLGALICAVGPFVVRATLLDRAARTLPQSRTMRKVNWPFRRILSALGICLAAFAALVLAVVAVVLHLVQLASSQRERRQRCERDYCRCCLLSQALHIRLEQQFAVGSGCSHNIPPSAQLRRSGTNPTAVAAVQLKPR